MNKTIDINLGGLFFHIDEKAYAILKKYLDDLRNTFSETEGKEDILADIEARFAELLSERKANKDQVIEVEDIEVVIGILGQPEDYMLDDETPNHKTQKKLFRDPDDSYIGGVASGLAHYFGVDVGWLRVIWAILLFFSGGSFLVIYLLFWILLPEAKTTAEKLQMKGEPVNIENIEKKIREEVSSLTDKVKNVDYEKAGNTLKSKSKTIADNLAMLFLTLIKIAGKVIGIILIVMASLSLFGITLGFIVSNAVSILGVFPEEILRITNIGELPIWLLMILILCLAGIPMLFLLMLGIKLLSPTANPFGFWGRLILLGLWVLSLITVLVMGSLEAQSFMHSYQATEQYQYPMAQKDTLFIRPFAASPFKERYTTAQNTEVVIDANGNKQIIREKVTLTLAPTDKDSIYLSLYKKANGASYSSAKEHAQNIKYNMEKSETELKLGHYFLQPMAQKGNHEIDVNVYLPEGQRVFIDDDLVAILGWNIPNDQEYIRRGIAGHYWEMRDQQLVCLDCSDKN